MQLLLERFFDQKSWHWTLTIDDWTLNIDYWTLTIWRLHYWNRFFVNFVEETKTSITPIVMAEAFGLTSCTSGLASESKLSRNPEAQHDFILKLSHHFGKNSEKSRAESSSPWTVPRCILCSLKALDTKTGTMYMFWLRLFLLFLFQQNCRRTSFFLCQLNCRKTTKKGA